MSGMGSEAKSTSPTVRQTLLEALTLYVADMKKQAAKTGPWLREPNNLISTVAIVLSLASFGWGFYKERRDDIDKDLAALSAVVADLTKLELDLTSARAQPNANPAVLAEVANGFANRRLVLLAEADRLTQSLGDKAPRVQLAVLGASFIHNLQYDKAIEYFTLTTDAKTPALTRMAAWRSLAAVNSQMGPAKYEITRKHFAEAVATIPDPQDHYSVYMVVEVHKQWAGYEVASGKPAEGLKILVKALELTTRMPCPGHRKQLFADLSALITPVVSHAGGGFTDVQKAISAATCSL